MRIINRNFTLLWVGKIISQLGDKFYAIALAWWILIKTNSPVTMGLFLFVSAFPAILLGLYGGVLADRLNRKILLVVTDLIRGALVLAISLLSAANSLSVWHLFVVGFLLSITTAFFEPSIQAIVPDIVENEKLTKANGLSQMVSGICTVAGPLFGSVSVSFFGLTWVFLFNSASYFVSALLSSLIRVKKEESPQSRPASSAAWADIREGLLFIKKRPEIVQVLKVIAVTHFFIGGLSVAIPFLAKLLAGNGITNLGLLEMAMGLGLFGCSVIIGLRVNIKVSMRRLLVLIGTLGLSLLSIGLLYFAGLQMVGFYMLAMAAVGCCVACASVLWQTLLQRGTPPDMTGRVFSISAILGNTALPLAYFSFGLLLDWLSVFILIPACGLCMMAIGILLNLFYCGKSNVSNG